MALPELDLHPRARGDDDEAAKSGRRTILGVVRKLGSSGMSSSRC